MLLRSVWKFQNYKKNKIHRVVKGLLKNLQMYEILTLKKNVTTFSVEISEL